METRNDAGRIVSIVAMVLFGAILLAFVAYLLGYLPALEPLVSRLVLSQDWQVFTPESVVLLFAVLAPLMALWDTNRQGMRQFTLIGLAGALLMVVGTMAHFHLGRFSVDYITWSAESAANGHPAAQVFRVTYASQLFKLVFLGVAFLAVLGLGRPIKGRAEEDFGEFCSLILFATLGMMLVASATELLTLLLGIEMTSMSSYLLAGFRRDRAGAEASLKYFTIGAIASGLMLFGISLLYGIAGTTRIPGIASAVAAHGAFDAVTLIPIAMVLAGIGFKISMVPFHAWAPDVYSGAPAPVAGMLAAGSKAMGFAAAFNIFLVGMAGAKANWELAIALLAVVSMTVGNLVALQQTNLRRMLAYSSIAQAGYVLIALVVSVSAQDGGVWAVGGGIFHLLTNAAMKLGAFLVIGALLYAGLGDSVDGWKGLGKRAPVLAFCMTLFLLSMAGLPPLGGFASKFVLFSSAVDAGTTQNLGWLTILAVVAILNSAISLYYYLRVIRTMYVEDGPEGKVQVPGSTIAGVAICALLVVVMGIWPQPFLQSSMQAAADLLGLHA